MKKFVFFIIALIIILAAIITWVFWPSKEAQQDLPEPQKTEKVFLIIGEKTFDFDYESGITAFDLLKRSGLDFQTKEYDFGIFIESIDSVENGQDNKYWLYYVNNQAPMEAADKVELLPEDVVEFRFEESPF